MRPPKMAPGTLPNPPNIQMINAFIPSIAPMLGDIMKMGATRQAATAANPVEIAKVIDETQFTLIPTSMAPS